MKKINILMFCLLIILSLNANTFNKYDLLLSKTIEIGQENDKIGLCKNPSPSQYSQGPYAIAFNKDSNLYIADTWNNRIVIYSSNFDYLNKIKEAPVSNFKYIEIDDNGNIIGYDFPYIIKKMDSLGNELYDLNLYKIRYKIDFDYNKVADYADLTGLGFILLKDGNVKVLENPTADIKENANRIKNLSEIKLQNNTIQTRAGETIRIENNLVFNGEELLFKDFTTYYNYKKGKLTAEKRSVKRNTTKDPEEFLKPGYSKTCLGEDNDGNVYYDANDAILVFNSDGVMIDAFSFDVSKRKTFPAVHPSGDIYTLDFDEKGVYLYKISRQW